MVNESDGIFLGKRYEILSKIGVGGMADVYKGKDHMLNRYVAVKVLKKEFRENEEFVKKFRSEAQAAAGLMNPNIVNVYDVGEDRGLYYMVMELVEGVTLKQYIEKKKKLSAKEVISIAIQMCSGIEAAHNRQIVHRDIKPQNVIISKDGKVKVTDFGIAKAATSNTVTTSVMGSVHYISPEQARGGYVDAKSDIYSVGITLYEMITGRVPFDGSTSVEVAVKHLQEDIIPPSEIATDIPYSLEQIILKCTQKNSECRYDNIGELIQDLKHSLVDPDGRFVNLAAQNDADTIIISEEDLDDIRSSYDDDPDYDEDEDYYDYDDDDYDDEDDDDFEDTKKKGSDEVNPRMNKIMKIMTIVIVAIIILVLGIVGAKAAGIFKFGPGITASSVEEKVKVPSLIGKTEKEAKDILHEKGLGYSIKREESKKYEEGTVTGQSVEAGKRVKKHTQIVITVSSKLVGDEITVPDVSGMNETDAQNALTDMGFTDITSEFTYSDSQEEGNVIETSPKAGKKVSKDAKIVMKVSKGSDKAKVPGLVGKTESEAVQALSDAGLVVGEVTYDYNENYEEGVVYSQSSQKGSKVENGTTINFSVSRGKKPEEKIEVENFVGKSESELISWASANGMYISLSGSQNSSNIPKGSIISQDPPSGSLKKGSTISYVVSEGPKMEEESTGN